MKKIDNYQTEKKIENPYLILDFWHFAILTTLMTVFFPWSLLFCVLVYGLAETKLIVLALIHDAVKTILALLSIVVSILVLVFVLFAIFAN